MLDRSELTGRSGGHASARLDCYVGGNIRQARNRQDMSLVDLGQVLGVQESSMADYESGRERLSATMLYRIAVTLDVTLASLFGVPRL
ncbi:MAG: helix-turn-helix transcriptional regulator [Janthinobacterium lividum]